MRFHVFLLALLALVLGAGGALAAKKIIYFTGGPVPTSGEKSTITTLSGQAAAPYTVVVRNGLKARLRTTPESADYYAGAIPPNYRDGGIDSGTAFATVYSVTNPPVNPALPSGQATLYNGQVVALPGGGSLTVTISANAITAVVHVAKDGGT